MAESGCGGGRRVGDEIFIGSVVGGFVQLFDVLWEVVLVEGVFPALGSFGGYGGGATDVL